MTPDELLAKATEFTVWRPPESDEYFGQHYNITVEYRGRGRWAICQSSFVYSKSSKAFIYSPMPSSRTEEHLDDTRFTFAKAIKIAEQLAKQYETAYQKCVADGKKGQGQFINYLPE